MEPQPSPPSGLVAGKYEVLRLIGRGGMGAVWEGRHTSLGTHVAIKFIDQEYADSTEARSRFDTEARAAAALQSKHAIQIFDHGVTDDGRPYMVMELLKGEPLDERLERLGRISLEETARIVGQVCRALQRAHDASIIHRDLKPENIFLVRSPDDDEEIAKVLDFGIAKIKAPPGEQGLTSSTKTGAVLGTPYYMAPEQARGLRTIDTRADLWSLGVIAYKCVTGVLPFEGESVGDLLVKICTAPPPVPSLTVPGLPPAFDVWFARTMEREPARRFATATELSDGITLAAGMSVRRPPMSSHRDGVATAYAPPAGAQTPLPAAGMTAAPFVTSARPAKSSRGLFLVVLAALVGGSVGVVGVVKLLAPPRTDPAPATSTAAALSASPTRSTTVTVVDPPATTTTVGPTTVATVAVPANPTGHARSSPGPHAGPATTAAPRPAPTATTPAATATAHPPPAKLPPSTSDPGY
jgi:serine/threonine-protein kinase